MKKILSVAIVLSLILMLSAEIYAFDYTIIDDTIAQDNNIELIEFIEEYFTELNVKNRLLSMTSEISEGDIIVESVTTYPSEGSINVKEQVNINGVDIAIDRELTNIEINEHIFIGNDAFAYLPDSFNDYIVSVATLNKALELYDHFAYSSEYFDDNEYVLLNPINLNDGHEGEPVIRYHSEKKQWIPEPSFMDTSVPNYVVYMQNPHTIEIGYNWNSIYAEFNPAWKRIDRTYIKLNYEADEKAAGDRKLVSIEMELNYFDDYYDVYAPQTGFATVAYAAVAVVAAAGAVALAKRRRKAV